MPDEDHPAIFEAADKASSVSGSTQRKFYGGAEETHATKYFA